MTIAERAIVQRACELGGIEMDVLLSPFRDNMTSDVRHAVMFCLRRKGGGLKHIGQILNRDHSTVMHGVRRVEYLLHSPQCPLVIRSVVDEILPPNVPIRPETPTWAPPEVSFA